MDGLAGHCVVWITHQLAIEPWLTFFLASFMGNGPGWLPCRLLPVPDRWADAAFELVRHSFVRAGTDHLMPTLRLEPIFRRSHGL
jgi:hypothetical protein